MDIAEVKEILKKLKLEERFNTDQTAICILIMLDKKKRKDLLFNTLNDGVRIHDIIKYSDILLSKKYAENTRESIRKSSLKRLVDHGLVIVNPDDSSRPTNSGNTNYILEKTFEEILRTDKSNRNAKIKKWLNSHKSLLKIKKELELKNIVEIEILSEKIKLSPGKHNVLIKEIVESFCQKFISDPVIIYIGDTKNKEIFKNVSFLLRFGFDINIHEKMPDVIAYDKSNKKLIFIESVTSVGPFEELRKKEVDNLVKKQFKNKKMIGSIDYITAFLDRDTFRKFSKIIAWNTSVWIATEPKGLINYVLKE